MEQLSAAQELAFNLLVERIQELLSGDTKTDPPGDTKTDPFLHT